MLVLGSENKNHGVIFDKFALMEHVMQFKKDPVRGDSLQLSDLIDLKMDRAEDGGGGGSFGWQCPVLCKKFTDYSKVVAVMNKKERVAHVLSYETLLELNYKANNMENLITGEPFSKKDVVWLQDPDNQKLSIRATVLSEALQMKRKKIGNPKGSVSRYFLKFLRIVPLD